ncbi:MAG: acyltransferase [Anaerolineae bacterium]|nr:acyltransferase [Anaerolineae bacterium]
MALCRLRGRLRRLEVNSDEWLVLQERLGGVGGELGQALRAVFYAHSLGRCGAGCRFQPGVVMILPQRIELGDDVRMNRGVYIVAQEKVSIGNHVLIGPYVHINSGNHRFEDPTVPIVDQGKALEPIIIEDDVWIAAHAVITAGSRIGRGSVVMAGAVVSGTVEPYSVVGGVPARLVRRRGERPAMA